MNGSNPYDALPYINLPFPQTHPARLAAQARLLALDPPHVGTCRVLELGCASGDNLIPMAVAAPQARFVGIDLSERQIERGRATIASLGLDNIELEHADILALDAAFGTFDYIVAHGVYSWVPAAVRDKLLAICAGSLVPNGVAYVSYNTLPGWSTHGELRELMLYDVREADDAAERVRRARAMLDFLAVAVPANTPHGTLVRGEVDRLRAESDAYLFHDHLEAVNEPVYFHRFVEHARAHGLKYLAEAELSMMTLAGLPPETIDAMKQLVGDIVAFEQMTDVVRNRAFRQTLLVHGQAPVDRRLGAHSIEPFSIASPVAQSADEGGTARSGATQFVARNGRRFSVANPLTEAALCALIERWPEDLEFAELFEVARAQLPSHVAPADDAAAARHALADELLKLYAGGIVQLRTWTPPVSSVVAERPEASPLARLQAQGGDTVTTLLHQPMRVDAFDRALIPLLDGTRDMAMLAASLSDLGFALARADDVGGASRDVADPVAAVRAEVARLAKAGLLLARR